MAKRGKGQPAIKWTDKIEDLEKAFSLGASDKIACGYAMISTGTYYKWKNLAESVDIEDTEHEDFHYLEFLQRIKSSKSEHRIELLTDIKASNVWQSKLAMLRSLEPEYREHFDITKTVKGSVDVNVDGIAKRFLDAVLPELELGETESDS